MIRVGQVYRDTYGDKSPVNVKRGLLNKRTVRVVGQDPDGRWVIELLTDGAGREPRKTPRRTRVSEKTLASGYVLERDAKA